MTRIQLTRPGRMARQVPPAPRRIGAVGRIITPAQVADARKDLGRRLAQWRASAGLRQVDLAKLICYSRSQIANVEVGRDNTTRRFWHNADTVLGAYGALLAMFDQVNALVRDFNAQRDHARDQERQRAAPPPALLTPGGAACSVACGGSGPAVVGRWTGREVRALREALRMSVPAFAEHLAMTTATISDWEHQTTPATPTLAAQSVLDQALTFADTHSKARFRLLLDNPDDPVPHPSGGSARADRSAVTPIHHTKRTRPAS